MALQLQREAQSRRRFEALDGCRGLFALVVALLHLHVAGHFLDWPFVRNGYLAVDFFFVLSGFVIAHGAADGLRDRAGVLRFTLRRFGRVWPLHAVMLFAFVGLELLKLVAQRSGVASDDPAFASGGMFDPAAIPLQLALAHSLGLLERNTWNGPSWSISVEFYTYLIFALSVLWSRKPWLTWLCLGGAGLGFLTLHSANIDVTYDYGLARCVSGFFVGAALHRAYLAAPAPGARGGTARELASAALALGFIGLVGHSRWSLLAPLVFALPIWVFAHEQGAISRWLKRPTLKAIGRWSFGIYMVHELVFMLCYRGARVLEHKLDQTLMQRRALGPGEVHDVLTFADPFAMDALALSIMVAVVGVAALAYHLVEQPGQRLFARLAAQLESPREAPRPAPRYAGASPPLSPARRHAGRLP